MYKCKKCGYKTGFMSLMKSHQETHHNSSSNYQTLNESTDTDTYTITNDYSDTFSGGGGDFGGGGSSGDY